VLPSRPSQGSSRNKERQSFPQILRCPLAEEATEAEFSDSLSVLCVVPAADCRPSQMIRDSVITSQWKMPWDTWNYWQMCWTASSPGFHRDLFLKVNQRCSESFSRGRAVTGLPPPGAARQAYALVWTPSGMLAGLEHGFSARRILCCPNKCLFIVLLLLEHVLMMREGLWDVCRYYWWLLSHPLVCTPSSTTRKLIYS